MTNGNGGHYGRAVTNVLAGLIVVAIGWGATTISHLSNAVVEVTSEVKSLSKSEERFNGRLETMRGRQEDHSLTLGTHADRIKNIAGRIGDLERAIPRRFPGPAERPADP